MGGLHTATLCDRKLPCPAVCRTLETQPHSSPFMCMDLTYISLLLQEFGFPRNKVLKVRTRPTP